MHPALLAGRSTVVYDASPAVVPGQSAGSRTLVGNQRLSTPGTSLHIGWLPTVHIGCLYQSLRLGPPICLTTGPTFPSRWPIFRERVHCPSACCLMVCLVLSCRPRAVELVHV